MRVVLIRLMALFAIALSSFPLEANEPIDARAYKLAPGDRITVTVFGQPELTGDFLIDGTGMIQMPLLEAVSVGQSTIEEARQKLTARLADGFLRNPAVSVRVAEFRPIYVLGDVRSPGSYPFHFGLSGLRAIALAGGIGLPDLRPGAALADLVGAEERVKVLNWTRLGLLVRLARVEAERDGKDSFEAPKDASVDGNFDMTTLLHEEREQLTTQRKSHEQTIALLHAQRPKVQQEIETTKRQIVVEERQVELIQSKLKAYGSLSKQGYGRSVTEVDFERQAADHEGIVSRLKGDIARLESQLGDLDIRVNEAETARQTRIMSDLRDIKLKLKETDALVPSAHEVLELRRLQTGTAANTESLERSYAILLTRAGVRQQVPLTAEEDIALEPGDMVEVRRLKADALPTPKRQVTTEPCSLAGAACAEKEAASLGPAPNLEGATTR